MSDRVKETVVTEAKDIKAASQDVVKSGAYLYPFKVSPFSMKSVYRRLEPGLNKMTRV